MVWALGRDFAWLLFGALLLGFLICLGEFRLLTPLAAFPLSILRLVLGLIYVLFAPGYCMSSLFFPRKQDLDGVERGALSVGLSIAWLTLLALILDHLSWGIRLWPVYFSEMLSLVVFMTLAFWQRARQPGSIVFMGQMTWQPMPWWQSLASFEKRAYSIILFALLLGASAAIAAFRTAGAEYLTEFYILNDEGLAEDYPCEGMVGQELSATMGINNLERGAKTYNIEVWAVDPWENQRELLDTAGPFFLDPEQSVARPITWAMPWEGDDLIVEFYLYTTDKEEADPYRALRLWLNVLPIDKETEEGRLIMPYGDG